MTAMLTNAAMPARSPSLNNTFESFRKLTALATPLPHPWSSSGGSNSSYQTLSRNSFSGNRVAAWKFRGSKQQQLAARQKLVKGEQLGCSSSDDGDDGEKVRRLHALSSFGHEENHAEIRSKRLDRNPSTELKSSWIRPEKAETGSRRTEWTPPEKKFDRRNFSRATLGINLVARNNHGGGADGNEDGGRVRSVAFRRDAEHNLSVEEQTRAAFEDWAIKKFREAGTPALLAIEEMRQTFAPGSPSLSGPRMVSSAVESQKNVGIGENSNKHNQRVYRSDFRSLPIAEARNSDMTSWGGAGGYRSSSSGTSRSVHRGPSSPTSWFGADRSEQQLMGRSSTRSESWSPQSTGTNRGRSAWNVTSRRGVQLAAEVEVSGKSSSGGESGGESTSASRSDTSSSPQPLLVKRATKFPVNWNGRAGTVMLVDKPQGWTSFAVCAKLRYLLKIQKPWDEFQSLNKVGHAGTLDPMATGLLIVCLGKATKLADSYQAMKKVYSGTIRLGELTPSLDSFTEVSDVLPWEHITDEQLEQAKQGFIGDIFQKPPMYSAIKVDGERLYKKARRGEQIEIPPRLITVMDFQLERSPENRQDIHFKVTCSKGTYVRSLCADLAQAVGSYAHLTALRREKIGTYSVKDAWPILEFVEQYSQTSQKVAINAEI